MTEPTSSLSRRDFLAASAAGLAVGGAWPSPHAWANETPTTALAKGKADHCIMIWLGGGACQIDTWDPKRKGDAKANKPGSYYNAIDTAVPGVQVCEHLKRCANVLDRLTLVRTVHHEVINEHAAATDRMHTGRPTSGTVIYPSIGSVVAHERGAAAEGVPPYILIGYPNVTRGPGFLGAKAGYVYLTDTRSGPQGLAVPAEITDDRQARRERLLSQMREGYRQRGGAGKLARDYDAAIEQALKLGGADFMRVFNLDDEPASLRNEYGGEFGQRCLLSRRLIESGVRFVEVSHNLNFVNGTGWDTHNDGQLNQHLLIQEMDSALSALTLDLERRKMLDRTLIVVSTEFGRPADFDGGGGRGHHAKSFTVALAGGGLKGGAIGTTNELGTEIVDRPVSVPDLHATIYWALGIDPAHELYAGDRPVPITDHGQPLAEAFA